MYKVTFKTRKYQLVSANCYASEGKIISFMIKEEGETSFVIGFNEDLISKIEVANG